jgi:ribosomal protein RSM22 (predicted rRNA methylase)
MPSRFILLKRIMKELKQLLPNYKPKRVFDFGCGPGIYIYICICVYINMYIIEENHERTETVIT